MVPFAQLLVTVVGSFVFVFLCIAHLELPFAEMNMCFPPLVLKGIDFTTGSMFMFSRGRQAKRC